MTKIDVEVGVLIDGVWIDATDVGGGVLLRDPIKINTGRSKWSDRVDSSKATGTLADRDGRWSPDYASGAYYGDFRRNIPLRVGRGHGDRYVTHIGGDGSADVVSTPDVAGVGGGSPTAPAFVDVTESSETSYITTHGVDMPATVAADDRLLCIINAGHSSLTPKDQGGGVTDFDDWTLVDSGNLYTPWNAWAIYEIGPVTSAQASALAGDTLEFSTTNAVKSSSQVIRTSGARAGGQGTGWDYQGPGAKTYSAAPDPPSLTASYGADEQRWYALAIYGSAGETVSANPTSYTAVADGDSSAGVGVASAHRTTSAATEDPAAYTLTGSENWMAATFVYRAEEDASTDGVLDISGDLDLRVDLQLHEDPPDVASTESRFRLAHKSSGLNGIEWEIFVWNGDLHTRLKWYDSSAVLHSVETDDAGTHLPFSALRDRTSIQVTLDVDNGASGHDVAFYTSDSVEGTWTQLGSTVTNSGTTDIATNDAPLRLAGNPSDAFHTPLAGKMFAFQMRDGIGGTAAADVDFTGQTVGASSFTGDDGLTWTVGAGGRITDMRWRFHGELASIPTRWNVDGSDVWSPIEAAGIFRRLRQGNRRLESPLRRGILRKATDVVQYWPCEEQGGGYTTRFGAAIGTNPIVVTVAVPDTGANTKFLASDKLATFGNSVWTATVDTYTATGAWQVRWLQSIPSDFTDNGTGNVIVQVLTSDAVWEIAYRDDSGGQFQVVALRGGVTIYSSAWTTFNATGTDWRMSLSLTQNGSDVDLVLEAEDPDTGAVGGIYVTSAVAASAGTVDKIVFNKDSDCDTWAVGHITLQSAVTAISTLADEITAHEGEAAGDRVVRLCDEEGIAVRIEGDPADSEAMGPQSIGTLMDLLEECAATDLGILHEPRETLAVGYRVRTSIIDQTAKIDLDYSAGEVAGPLDLDRDDADFANDVEVKNWTGTTARSVLDDGTAMSISDPPDGSGVYDRTFALSGSDSRLQALADSRLALSSVDEPRVSSLKLGLHYPALSAAQVTDILDSSLGDRIQVTDVLPVALGTADVNQIIQGAQEAIGNYEHTLDLLTSPATPWGLVDADPVVPPDVTDPPEDHSVSFRTQQDLAYAGSPSHVLTALGYTSTTKITRSDLDGILDDWVTSTGGTTRNVTSAATWTTAINAAEPGDLIRVTTGFDSLIDVRGNRYSISGNNLTTSPSGGLAGLPIIVTCADGVYVDDNNTSSGAGVLDLTNCEHVWAVGFNVRDGQFGIRCQNWGGSEGYPAYVAYCSIDNIGDAGLVGEGWYQLITSSGGTPPSGSGNEWGFSNYFVFEENDIDGTGVRTGGHPGEGIYLGHGGSPGWIGYCKDAYIRGNRVTDWTSDGLDLKPGCQRIYITDNEFHTGHAVQGSPMGLLYVASGIDDRDGTAFDADPLIYVEGNRVYDSDLTNTNGSSVHIMGYIGLSGIRIKNNVMWAKPETGTHPMWRVRNEKGANDTEALAEFRADPVELINNTLWGDDALDNAGYGAGGGFPVAFPSSVTTSWDQRNNIVDQASPATGEVDAAASDFIATVPAIGVAGDAEWSTYGNGSAFDLDPDSALVGAGADVSDVTFLIDRDISDREFDDKTAPNPGAFQPHPANL